MAETNLVVPDHADLDPKSVFFGRGPGEAELTIAQRAELEDLIRSGKLKSGHQQHDKKYHSYIDQQVPSSAPKRCFDPKSHLFGRVVGEVELTLERKAKLEELIRDGKLQELIDGSISIPS